jgi:hypothetical protein
MPYLDKSLAQAGLDVYHGLRAIRCLPATPSNPREPLWSTRRAALYHKE